MKNESHPTWGGARPGQHGGARPGSGPKPVRRKIADFAALGDAPSDELDAAKWCYRALAVSMRQVQIDPRLTDKARREEIRALARAMHTLMPRVRLRRAERVILGEEAKKRAKVDVALVPVPAGEPPRRRPGAHVPPVLEPVLAPPAVPQGAAARSTATTNPKETR